MQKHQEQMKSPISVSSFFFVLTVISLLVLSLFIVTLPLSVPALVHIFATRKRYKASLESSQAASAELTRTQEELQRVSAELATIRAEKVELRASFDKIEGMDFLQREDESRRLDNELLDKKAEFESVLSKQVSELEALKEMEDAELQNYESRKQTIQNEINSSELRVSELKHNVVNLEEMFNLNDYGLYNFENPANDSIRYGEQLQKVKADIKRMVKNKTATSATTNWTVNESAAQGRKMVNDMSKLLLRAFNAEAENSIKTVRAGHLTTAIKRLDRSAQAVARLGKMMDLRITSSYVRLREEELRLTHAHLEAKKAAKELEREERAREREERQAQKELAAAKAKQAKEVEHYRAVVEALQSSEDNEAIAAAKLNLESAEEKLSDVESTMANTRAGYVYVISNRGAFGPGIIKIGMTRRLNPEERVRELGDASVPFYFDTHTFIFAKDAVGLERALHKEFAAVRLNLVNLRREFFYATPTDVKEALVKLHSSYEAQLLEFHEPADAPEYEASEDMRTKGAIPQPAVLAGITH